jgi:putative Mg2+ transporter-C (MgtC) family protein
MLGFNQVECALGRRVFVAAILGAMIGLERKTADRPAGVSTMSLVSIGAAVFTIVSAFGFHHSPVIWDSSRVSAKIPDGIGFLCAGVVFKTSDGTIKGITTAASMWLSAAVGTAAGCGMYFPAVFTAMLTLFFLKYGPRLADDTTNGGLEDYEDEDSGYLGNAEESRRLFDHPAGTHMIPMKDYGSGISSTNNLRRRRSGRDAVTNGLRDIGNAAVMMDW